MALQGLPFREPWFVSDSGRTGSEGAPAAPIHGAAGVSCPIGAAAHHTQITLNRLNSRNVRAMVGQVAAQKALSEETIAAVVERTGGVPLFVEELTRAGLESGILR